MTKKILSLFFILVSTLLLSNCSNELPSKENNTLSFQIENTPDSTLLFINVNNDIDSVLIENGKGEWSFAIEQPTKIFLKNNKRGREFRYKFFWLDKSDINLEGDYNDFRNLNVLGSEAEIISSAYMKIQNNFRPVIYNLEKLEKDSDHSPTLLDLRAQILATQAEYRVHIITEMEKHLNSLVTLDHLKWKCIDNTLSKLEIKSVYDKLDPKLKESELGKNILHYTTLPPFPKVGEKYIDFTQTTVEGDTVSLSDYEGKITFLSYWSANCGASLQENPIIVEAYKKYHPLGLEILGVSDETDKDKFMQNLEESGLPWVNATDYKSGFNEAAMLYNFRQTPNNILINKEGIITHRNLRVAELLKVLEEIFSEESS